MTTAPAPRPTRRRARRKYGSRLHSPPGGDKEKNERRLWAAMEQHEGAAGSAAIDGGGGRGVGRGPAGLVTLESRPLTLEVGRTGGRAPHSWPDSGVPSLTQAFPGEGAGEEEGSRVGRRSYRFPSVRGSLRYVLYWPPTRAHSSAQRPRGTPAGYHRAPEEDALERVRSTASPVPAVWTSATGGYRSRYSRNSSSERGARGTRVRLRAPHPLGQPPQSTRAGWP